MTQGRKQEKEKREIIEPKTSNSKEALVKSFDDRLEEKITRRKAIGKMGSVAVGVVVAAAVAGTVGYYLGGSQVPAQTKTQTQLSTVTPSVTSTSSSLSTGTPSGLPIKVGLVTFVTGPWGGFGAEYVQGINVVIDDWNARGGLLGRPVQLVLADDGSDSTKDADLTTGLITVNGVDLIVGAGGAVFSAAQFPIWYRYGYPVIDHSWTYSEYTSQEAQNGYDFNIGFPGWELCNAYCDLVTSQPKKPKTIAILTGADPATSADRPWMTKYAPANYNLEVVYSNSYETGLADFTPLITDLMSSGADVTFLTGDQPDVANAIKSMGTQGYTPMYPPGMNAGPDAVSLWSGLGNIGLNVLQVNAPIGAAFNAVAQKNATVAYWLNKFIAKYGSGPIGFEFFIADALNATLYAAQQAGSLDLSAVKDAIQTKMSGYQSINGWACDFSSGPPYNLDSDVGVGTMYGQNNKAKGVIRQFFTPTNTPVVYPPNLANATTLAPWPATSSTSS